MTWDERPCEHCGKHPSRMRAPEAAEIVPGTLVIVRRRWPGTRTAGGTVEAQSVALEELRLPSMDQAVDLEQAWVIP